MNLSLPQERDKGLLLWYPCLGKEVEKMRGQILYWNQEKAPERSAGSSSRHPAPASTGGPDREERARKSPKGGSLSR